MFSLIITLLALLLVTALALATAYFGAELSQAATAKKTASRWLNEANQVMSAMALRQADTKSWPEALEDLTPAYLSTEPAPGAAGPWAMPLAFSPVLVQPTLSVPACRELNRLSRGDDGILLKAYPSLRAQCFGESASGLQVVVSANAQALSDALPAGLVDEAPVPLASSTSDWFVLPGAPATAGTPQPKLSLAPSSLALGPVAVGASADSELVTVTNTGEVSAPSLSFSALPASVSVLTNSCTSALAAGSTCAFRLRFAPTAQGSLDTSLNLLAGSASATLSLDAVGQGVARGVLTAVTSTDFGTLAVGSTAFREFVFSNPGSADATGVYASIASVSGLSFTSNTCGTAASPVSVAPGSSCTVRVGWTPSVADSLSGYPALVRVQGAFETASESLQLSGTAGGFNASAKWSSTWGSTVAPTTGLTNWGTYNLQTNNVAGRFYFLRNEGTVGTMSLRFKAVGDSSFYTIAVHKISNTGSGVSCGSMTYNAERSELLTACTTDSTYRHLQVYVEYTPRTAGTHVVRLTPSGTNGVALPEPLELRAVAAFDPTGVWSTAHNSTVVPSPAFSSVRAGNCLDRILYMRNVGSHGALSASLRLEGDTEYFKFPLRTGLATQSGAYGGTCSSVLSADKLSVSECAAAVPNGSTGTPVHLSLTVQFCPTDTTPRSVRIVPTSANGSTLPEPLELTGQGLWDITSAWSGRSDAASALPGLGAVAVGSSQSTTVYLRASGSWGNLMNSLQLTGDTQHVRISAVRKVNHFATDVQTCGSTIAADGASATACTANLWAGTIVPVHIAVTLTYAPTESGAHTVTLSAPSQNLTPTPGVAVLSGFTPISAQPK